MVAWYVGYFGKPFKGHLSVTKGNPLYPTIFYVVVYMAIRKWILVVMK